MLGLCAFDLQSERKSRTLIKFYKKKRNKNACLVIFGCFGDITNSIEDGKENVFALKYNRLNKIDDILNSKIKIEEVPDINVIDKFSYSFQSDFNKIDMMRIKAELLLGSPLKVITRFKCGIGPQALRQRFAKDFLIRIVKGCTGKCTYCAIKMAAGDLVSYPIESILDQIKNGLEMGYRTFRLVGEDVGGYGKDCGKTFVELIEKIFKYEQPFRLVIEDFSPKWLIRFSPDIIRIFSQNQDRVCHIVIPIQTGSEKIVRKMGRKYTVAAAVELLLKLRNDAPQLKIATHVIVGFPGETEDDFQKTIAVLKRLKFEHIEAHCYTDRPNTVASKLPDKIPEHRKIMRLWRLRSHFPDTCRIRV